MASRDIKDLDPAFQEKAQQFLDLCNKHPVISAAGATTFLTCTYRSDAEQNADYAQGRTTPGKIITNAIAGQSSHNCVDANGHPSARGFDFAIKKADGSLDWAASDNLWQTALAIGKSLGLVEGACWHMHDNPHLEELNWRGFGPTTGADT